MSRENVEIVRQTWARYEETGHLDDLVPAFLAILADDVEIYDHDVPDAPFLRGREGFGRWLEIWDSAWEEFRMEPEEVLDAGDRVVVVFRMTATGRGSGLKLERLDSIVHTLRDGKLARIDYYNNKAEALEAAGLSE